MHLIKNIWGVSADQIQTFKIEGMDNLIFVFQDIILSMNKSNEIYNKCSYKNRFAYMNTNCTYYIVR